MANYKQLYMDYMDENGIKYSDVDDFVVRVAYTGDNLKSIPVHVFFDKTGDSVINMVCFEIANFKSNTAAGLIACNEMNSKYRWVKFYIDNDGDLFCSLDAYIDEDTCGEECRNLVGRIVNIVDEAYPVFMRALWAN